LAKALVHDKESWILIDDILYHLYNPRKRNVNSVKGITQQLAVPLEFCKQVLHAFHDDSAHWRLDKCYLTILQHYFWPDYTANYVST